MDLAQIKKLIKVVEGSDISEIEIEEENSRIKISKQSMNVPAGFNAASFSPVQHYTLPQTSETSAPKQEQSAETPETNKNIHLIKSPIVGTFYSAPAPDADPYVKVGDSVSPGSVLCIVEAMKLMNEIESDAAGKITKILVENAKPVEYNQPLFEITTA